MFLADPLRSFDRNLLPRSETVHDPYQIRFPPHQNLPSVIPRAKTLIPRKALICVGRFLSESASPHESKLDRTGTESIPFGETEIFRNAPDQMQISNKLPRVHLWEFAFIGFGVSPTFRRSIVDPWMGSSN
jgi:hypothetical protein